MNLIESGMNASVGRTMDLVIALCLEWLSEPVMFDEFLADFIWTAMDKQTDNGPS